MALLAEEITAQIVDELRVSPKTSPHLERETGAAQKKVAQTLALLQAHGVVSCEYEKDGEPGRPSRLWVLDPVADEELGRLELAADRFKQVLLQHELTEYEDLQGTKRREKIKKARSDSLPAR